VHGTYPRDLADLAFFLTAISLISVMCSECTPPPPKHMRIPNLIYAGFFILRTYALWNHNRIVLAAMLLFFLVSLMSLFIPRS
jgi:hypothetical protein